MLHQYFQSPYVLNQLKNGVNGAWMDGFASSLHEAGYSWWTTRAYLRAAHHFGHFIEERQIALTDDGVDTVALFQKHLRDCRCPRPRGGRQQDTMRGVRCFLAHLWTNGTVPRPPKKSYAPLVHGFRHWLSRHRGVSESTLNRYSSAATELVTKLGDDPGQFDAKRLRAFMLARADRRGSGGTKAISSALRMFLRYLSAEGKCAPELDAAIPAIARWKLAALPRSLSADEVDKILAACNCNLPMGLRDRAVILLLARLGLRAADVAALRIVDIDWKDGSFLVRGKNRRETRLPLPQDVGDAILAYLEHRPSIPDDFVFLRSVAPFRALPDSSVSHIVRRAIRRAGVPAPTQGSHVLRHFAASEMLRRGASLYDIGSVLRHRSVDMTAYYAKVDMTLLSLVARPWPEVLSC